MTNFRQRVELFANIAIVIVCVLISAALIHRFFISTTPSAPKQQNEILKNGDELPLAGMDWSESGKTLVLAVSKTCHFCTESVPFYQRLAKLKPEHGSVNLVGVMPQSQEEAQIYFKDQNIPLDKIISTNLSNIYVQGTPTLILVDEHGSVVESWVGKLPPQREDEVISRVFGEIASK